MARLDNNDYTNIIEQNGRKHFLQKVTVSGTGGLTTLATTDVYSVSVPKGAMLVLQGNVDFWYELRNAKAGSSAVTDYTGARPGTHVLADQQEYVVIHHNESTWGGDTKIDIIASGAGFVVIHWSI